MSESYDVMSWDNSGDIYLVAYKENISSAVEEKLHSFSHLEEGWDYGAGGPIPPHRIGQALAWTRYLRSRGFFQIDASPGTDGEVSVGGKLGNHYVEIILEPDDTISVAYDRNRKQIFYTVRQPFGEASRIILKLMDEIWSASTSFTAVNTMPQPISGSGRLSATMVGHSQSSALTALLGTGEAFAGTSRNFMVAGGGSSANPLYFGALTQESSQREVA